METFVNLEKIQSHGFYQLVLKGKTNPNFF